MKTTKREINNLKYFIDLTNFENSMDENQWVFENELSKINNPVLSKKYSDLKNSIISVLQQLKKLQNEDNK